MRHLKHGGSRILALSKVLFLSCAAARGPKSLTEESQDAGLCYAHTEMQMHILSIIFTDIQIFTCLKSHGLLKLGTPDFLCPKLSLRRNDWGSHGVRPIPTTNEVSLGNILATVLVGPLLGVSPEVTLAATMRRAQATYILESEVYQVLSDALNV